jgi:ribosomal protein L7Ae-like RNA K-turn-binding protein
VSDIKILRLIGLARKAGALAYGIGESAKARARLVLTARDLSGGTRAKLLKNTVGTAVYEIPFTKEEIGAAIGTKPTGIVSILSENFKKGILEVILFENKKES